MLPTGWRHHITDWLLQCCWQIADRLSMSLIGYRTGCQHAADIALLIGYRKDADMWQNMLPTSRRWLITERLPICCRQVPDIASLISYWEVADMLRTTGCRHHVADWLLRGCRHVAYRFPTSRRWLVTERLPTSHRWLVTERLPTCCWQVADIASLIGYCNVTGIALLASCQFIAGRSLAGCQLVADMLLTSLASCQFVADAKNPNTSHMGEVGRWLSGGQTGVVWAGRWMSKQVGK